MDLQTYVDLRIEPHRNGLVTITNEFDFEGNSITASADAVCTLLKDIRRGNGTSHGPLQLRYDQDVFAYVITHRYLPGSVVLTDSEYREVRDALIEKATSD